jgi:1-acyl-sn-glycerol-3-phosphate acyltransferase
MFNRIIKILFFALLIRPLVFVILGLIIRGKNNLPLNGPAVITSNHNSHLDTMVIMSLYPLAKLHKIRPVAAADYFLSNRFLAWFSLVCVGIIPLERKAKAEADKSDLFNPCHQALDNGDIVILFPEGTRGNPEEISTLKKGIFHLVHQRKDTQITPVVMHGLGKALPRGEALFVPFNCDVIIGETLSPLTTADKLVSDLSQIFTTLLAYCVTRHEP